jgi:glycolate oxidase FAD binding subunit
MSAGPETFDWSGVLGRTPETDLSPADRNELAELVAQAAREGKAIIPWGGGTGQDYGNLPRRADWVVRTGGLNRVVSYDHEDMTVTVEAGMTIDALQRVLASRGQFLPLDPPDADVATVGGMLAVDAWSSRRLGYGRCRDWLIGLEALDAQGRVVRGGGKVVKNVSGYDLPKLFCGSLGTLSFLTEATFKVSPLPEAVRTVVVRAEEALSGAVVSDMARTGSPVSLTLHLAPSGERHLVAVHHGAVEAVEQAASNLRRLLSDRGAPDPGVFDQDLTPQLSDSAIELRISGKASETVALAEAVAAECSGTGAELLARLGVGDVRCVWTRDTDAARAAMARLRALATVQGLRSVLHHAPAELRGDAEPDAWLPVPPSLGLQRQLKKMLDPEGMFNPGRFAGRI